MMTRPMVPCSTPGCELLMTGLSRFGCRKCQNREYRRRKRLADKGIRVAEIRWGGGHKFPLMPCSTPGCDRQMTGRSRHGCRACQMRAWNQKVTAERRCPRCAKATGGGWCPECLRKRRAREKLRKRAKAMLGLCSRCSRHAVKGYTNCHACSRKQKDYYHRKKATTTNTESGS